ncbi:MAG: C4-dicarboxylate transporter DctA [Candidatus Sericytochromatia bacterium]|nr:C4-dicarboxylate transporter DctA [Candidatus Sericytochromatia bacterium]
MNAPQAVGGGSRGLTLQVLAAVAVGVLLGVLAPAWGMALKPLGDGFVKLVKLLIGPIVFVTVAGGLATMGDMRSVGRVGVKALLYFEAVTTLALLLGYAVAKLVEPGAGAAFSLPAAPTPAVPPTNHGLEAFLLGLIPAGMAEPFARGDTLQVLVLALLTGLALAALGEHGRPIARALEAASTLLFTMVGLVMRLAPLGAFGAMAYTVGKHGASSLAALGTLVACVYGACLAFVVVVLGGIAHWHGISLWRFTRYLRDELLVVFATSSSEPALPRLLLKLENLGCARRVAALVLPTGYSFNLDGTAIYLTLGALFVAQATHTPLTGWQEATLLGVLLLTSKGAAGVTGSGFVTLAATLAVVPAIPASGLALLLGVDRFLSEARALTNFLGNGLAVIVVSRWEGAFDEEKARAILEAA